MGAMRVLQLALLVIFAAFAVGPAAFWVMGSEPGLPWLAALVWFLSFATATLVAARHMWAEDPKSVSGTD